MLDKKALKWLVLLPFVLGIGFNTQAMGKESSKETGATSWYNAPCKKADLDCAKKWVKYADCICVGKVVKIEGHPEDFYRSWVSVEVQEYLKREQDTSQVEQDTIIIKTWGGLVDPEKDLGVTHFFTPGGREPTLEKIGEEVMLFLTRTPRLLRGMGKQPNAPKAEDYFEIVVYYKIEEGGKVLDWRTSRYVSELDDFKGVITIMSREKGKDQGGENE
jgi:hypothetical protein